MTKVYNPPPNWPVPPAGWVPHDGWKPHPSWGKPPAGWRLWVDAADAPPKYRSTDKEPIPYSYSANHLSFGYTHTPKSRLSINGLSVMLLVVALAVTGLLAGYSHAYVKRFMPNSEYYYFASGHGGQVSQDVPYSLPVEMKSEAVLNSQQNPPVVLEGDGPSQRDFINPSGVEGPMWAEYEFTPSEEDIKSYGGDIRFIDKNSSEDTYHDIINPRFDERVKAIKGSVWVGLGEKPSNAIRVQDYRGHWKVTLHSAKDAPVVSSGDKISGSSDNQAFLYQSDKPGSVKVDYAPSSEENLNSSEKALHYSLAATFSLNYSYHDRGVYSAEVFSSDKDENQASTAVMQGSYPMQVNAYDSTWNLSFTDSVLPGIPQNAHKITYDESRAATITGKGDEIVDLVRPDGSTSGPALLKYSLKTRGTMEVEDNWPSQVDYLQPLVFAGDTGYAPLSLDEYYKASSVKVETKAEWELSILPLSSIPTYGPGDVITADGPAVFYWDGSKASEVQVNKLAKGNWQEDQISIKFKWGEPGKMESYLGFESLEPDVRSIFDMPAEKVLVAVQNPAGSPWSMSFAP